MKRVNISQLKSHLSEHIRSVRGGENIVVLDRDNPVAEIVPIRPKAALKVRMPAPGSPALSRVPLPKPLGLELDVLDLLLEERQIER